MAAVWTATLVACTAKDGSVALPSSNSTAAALAGCGGSAQFPASALKKQTPNQARLFADKPGVALRRFLDDPSAGAGFEFQPGGSWLDVRRSSTEVFYLYRTDTLLSYVSDRVVHGKWKVQQWGGPCHPRRAGSTVWHLANQPNPDTMTLSVVYASGSSCYPPGVLVPIDHVDVVENENSVALAAYLKADTPPHGYVPPKNSGCAGVGLEGTTSVTLRQPLGNRTVLDGAALPPAPPGKAKAVQLTPECALQCRSVTVAVAPV